MFVFNWIHSFTQYILSFVYYWSLMAWIAVFGLTVFLIILDRICTRTFPVPQTIFNLLITGCDTGFGRIVALQMAKRGFRVYAGVFNEEKGKELRMEFLRIDDRRPEGEMIPLVFDITKESQINDAFGVLNKDLGDIGLHLLVNNAGIGSISPLEIQPFEDIRKTIEVNLIGHIYVIQKALPLMRKARAPRIVNITSLGGRLGAPLFCAESASKFGMEGLTDSLRRELRPLDFFVSAVEPGFTRTPIVNNLGTYMHNVFDRASESAKTAYQQYMDVADRINQHAIENSSSPNKVADAIIHALTDPRPHIRYHVGVDATISLSLMRVLPDTIIDSLMFRLPRLFQRWMVTKGSRKEKMDEGSMKIEEMPKEKRETEKLVKVEENEARRDEKKLENPRLEKNEELRMEKEKIKRKEQKNQQEATTSTGEVVSSA